MKPLRFLLIGFSALALLVVIAVALAFTPGVQTWAARKFAPATPGLTVVIGGVNAGLNGARVENIRVVQPGLVLTLPSAEVEVNVIDAAGGKVEVRKLVAKGWILDLTAPLDVNASLNPPSAVSDPSRALPSSGHNDFTFSVVSERTKESFDGIFKLIHLPVDLAVDGVDLAGEVILPDGRAQVTVTGGGVAAGSDGKFAVTVDFKSLSSVLSVRSAITARMATPRTFERFEVTVNAAAKSPDIPEGATVALSASVAREGEGEAYRMALRSGPREVFAADIKLPAGAAPLAGTWKIDAVTADAAPFALGRPLPDFIAKGQGTFETDRLFSQIKTAGSLDASLDKLSALQPGFAELGRLTVAAGFDVATQGDTVNLQKLDVRVAGAKPVLTIIALQSVSFNTATRVLTAANPAAELLRITLDGLPLVWAKPFLGDLALAGEDVRGAFAVTAADGGFAVRPAAPIALGKLSVTQAGRPLVRDLDIALSTEADYSPKGWTAQVTDLSVRNADATLLKVTAKAAQAIGATDQPLTATGTYEISLPAVLAQPVAAGTALLRQGVARGDFTASLAKISSATLTLQLADLVAADDLSSPLPSVALQARADISASGRIDAQAPIIITQGKRRSDVTLAAVVTPGEKNTDIQAKLTSENLHVPDLMVFSAISPAPAEPAAPEAPVPVKSEPAPAPTGPLWAGITGELKLAFKKIVYSKDIQVNDVEGVVKITPAALTLETIQAALKTGGNLKASGGLRFEEKKKQPYALKADVALTEVDPAPILRSLSPGQPSPVEGKFDLTTQLSGRAVQPAGFGENAVGDIVLTSKGGTFRALSINGAAFVKGAGQAAEIAGLIGSLAGSKSTVKYADRARAAADVTKQLAAFKFDRFNVVVGRDKKKNLAIKDLTLVSPLVRLTGTGQIAYKPGVPLMQQPLLLNLKLGAADKLAADLRTLKLIEGKADKDGYSALAEDLVLDGTLQAIGTKQLSGLIERAMSN